MNSALPLWLYFASFASSVSLPMILSIATMFFAKILHLSESSAKVAQILKVWRNSHSILTMFWEPHDVRTTKGVDNLSPPHEGHERAILTPSQNNYYSTSELNLRHGRLQVSRFGSALMAASKSLIRRVTVFRSAPVLRAISRKLISSTL